MAVDKKAAEEEFDRLQSHVDDMIKVGKTLIWKEDRLQKKRAKR